jgi:GTP-binding protein YchF
MLYGEKIKVGFIGIPSSGKTTIFNLLCKASAEVAPYPFTTKSKNQGIMVMYEPRVEVLGKILKSSEIKYPAVEIIDVAGLIKGAHEGLGLGNEFLSYIRPLDVAVYVLRFLKSVPHVEGKDDLKRDFDVLRYEVSMSDLEVLSRREEKIKKLASAGQKDAQEISYVLEKIKKAIEQFAEKGEFKIDFEKEKEKKIAEEEIKSLQLITAKPYFIIINTDLGKDRWDNLKKELGRDDVIICDAISEFDLTEDEIQEFGITPLRQLITEFIRKIADLVIFFTGFEGKELRSWIAKKGINIFEAAGMIHSDMQKGFISAEVAKFEEYKNCLSDEEAYKKGIFKTVGKDYIIEDGDIIRIKFKV